MKILGISGTIIGTKPVALLNTMLSNIKNKSTWDVELLDLSKYKIDFCDGRQESNYSKDTQTVIQKVKEADAYIVGTPIFNSSFPAPLKNVIDLVPPHNFKNKIMGFVATGKANHYLVVENQLKPIAGYLQTFMPPTYIFAPSDNFDENNNIVGSEILKNIDQMTDQLIRLGNVVD